MNIGAKMAGGQGQRRAHDFYPTPWPATEALCQFLIERGELPADVDEPCCGDGAIASVLAGHGIEVHATDLIDRGFGAAGIDFLQRQPTSPNLITNPPFKLAAEFIERAHRLYPGLRAFLLKVQFWNAAGRLPLFRSQPPRWVLPLTFRMDVTGQGAPTMDVMWCVWGTATRGYQPLEKPTVHPAFA